MRRQRYRVAAPTSIALTQHKSKIVLDHDEFRDLPQLSDEVLAQIRDYDNLPESVQRIVDGKLRRAIAALRRRKRRKAESRS